MTGNLLAAWNQLSSENEKFFRFRTANDVYTVPSSSEGEIMTQAGDLGTTASGTLNIVGVVAETAEGEPEQTHQMDIRGGDPGGGFSGREADAACGRRGRQL